MIAPTSTTITKLLLVLSLLSTGGCLIWDRPHQLNSFRSYIGTNKEHLDLSPVCASNARPKHFVLLHGIYGDGKTFGRLPELLTTQSNYACAKSVHIMDYWSSRFFPNFQRLEDLGNAFESNLREIANRGSDEDIFIIAHSQGGLIARHAIAALASDPAAKDIVNRITLIMIGTPNLPSAYATLNNAFVNSVLFPATYGFALLQTFVKPVVKEQHALIYNRQAFDMADNGLFSGRQCRPSWNH